MAQQLPTGSSHLSFSLAAATALGGVAGYARSGSARSLAAGITFGAGYAYVGYLIAGHEQLRGFRLGTSISVALTGLMGYRYFKTGKVMPAVPLASLGVLGAVYHGAKYVQWSQA